MEPRLDVKPPAPTKVSSPYWDKFARLQILGHDPDWLRTARYSALEHFVELGFPTLQDEDWRFTNVAPIARLPFRPILEPATNELPADLLGRFPFASLPGPRLVFVNGHFAPALSSLPRLPGSVVIRSLAEVLATEPALLEKHLFYPTTCLADAFARLNTAFFQDGAFVRVGPGCTFADPVRIVYLTLPKENGATICPRNLIITEPGSQLTFIESYVSLGEVAHMTSAVTELVVGDGALVELVRFQDESLHAFHVGALQAHLGRASNFTAHSIATGARLSRTNINATLAGTGPECVLNGLYLVKADQLVDHHMIVEHAQPHGTSHEYFNGILADRAKGVFQGRILVRPGAQKTDAKQTNRNLLLSDDAVVDTKPQLEIYADDVKCTHGATIGQLDEEAIFYLRSRGLSLDTARRMLIHAFASEIIERIRHDATREELDKLVWERLEQHPLVAQPPGNQRTA